jgi:hypothetical protein
MNLLTQIRNNLLSIISLIVAISALSYNTYRNELTEVNRNIRSAGFEVLKELNQLQLLIDYSHYDKNSEHGNPIEGWAHVTYIQDMSKLISSSVITDANQLNAVWSKNWQFVKVRESSNKNVTSAINELRKNISVKIKSLR